jgi:hypothetical protein
MSDADEMNYDVLNYLQSQKSKSIRTSSQKALAPALMYKLQSLPKRTTAVTSVSSALSGSSPSSQKQRVSSSSQNKRVSSHKKRVSQKRLNADSGIIDARFVYVDDFDVDDIVADSCDDWDVDDIADYDDHDPVVSKQKTKKQFPKCKTVLRSQLVGSSKSSPKSAPKTTKKTVTSQSLIKSPKYRDDDEDEETNRNQIVEDIRDYLDDRQVAKQVYDQTYKQTRKQRRAERRAKRLADAAKKAKYYADTTIADRTLDRVKKVQAVAKAGAKAVAPIIKDASEVIANDPILNKIGQTHNNGIKVMESARRHATNAIADAQVPQTTIQKVFPKIVRRKGGNDVVIYFDSNGKQISAATAKQIVANGGSIVKPVRRNIGKTEITKRGSTVVKTSRGTLNKTKAASRLTGKKEGNPLGTRKKTITRGMLI